MLFDIDGNTMTAYGQIWNGDGMYFIQALKTLEDKDGEITIKLHTPGGSVFDGNLIHNALRDSKADIRIEIIGIAASMGAVIALSRDKVYMAENGFLMIHPPSGVTRGNEEEHLQAAKLLRSIKGNFIKKLKNKTGKNEKLVAKWMSGDNWFDAETAKSEKLITGVIDPEADVEGIEPDNMGNQAIYDRFAAVLMPPSSTSGAAGNEVLKQVQDDRDKSNNQSNKNDMEILAQHLGLEKDANEQAVLEAVQEKEDALANAKLELDKLQDKADKFEKAQAKRQEAELATTLSAAIKDGRIAQSAEKAVKDMPFRSAMELLNSLPSRRKVADQMDAEPMAKYQGMSWNELDKKGLLAEMKKADGAYYAERFEKEFGKKPGE